MTHTPLRLPQGPFSAFIFDLDGTIVDSMPLHYEAWKTALAPYGCDFPEDLFYSWAGVPTDKIVTLLNEKFGLTMPVADVLRKKEDLFQLYLPTIKTIPETVELLEAHKGKLPMGVVSGGPIETVRQTLEAIQLADCFQTILGAENYARGKPAPDGFLLAARNLKAKPQTCLVFEDADLGIQAAEAAGMKWVRVPKLKR
jgi:HAD superfamily hydrolase (TIGR01509 family)